jgi:hypothetical protein
VTKCVRRWKVMGGDERIREWLPSLFTVPAVSFSEPNFQDFPEDDGTIILQRSLVSLLRR